MGESERVLVVMNEINSYNPFSLSTLNTLLNVMLKVGEVSVVYIIIKNML